jgi:hypothetical protein
MWNWCDDYGVGEWTPRELLGFAFPNDEEVTSAEFQSLCTEVAACFGTQFYVVRGRRFYYIPAWDDHQKNERRASGKYPRPDVPEASPDQEFYSVAEKRGSSARKPGVAASGTGNREQGTGEQGNREQSSPAVMERAQPNLDELFDEAYAHWPKKVEKKAALEKFKAAAKRIGADRLTSDIIRFGDAYAIATTKKFTPGLNVWIGHERWTDELPTPDEPATKQLTTKADQNAALFHELYGNGDDSERTRSISATDPGIG